MNRIGEPKESVRRAATRFERQCSDPNSDTRLLREDARKLYAWIVEPFAAQFTEADRQLTFELDGVFSGLPVQALLSSDGTYLGDRFSVLISTGYATAKTVDRMGRYSGVVLVSNPAVSGESAARFPPLPEGLVEAEAVRRAFEECTVLQGPNATIRRLVAELPRADVFHFAGHGYADSDNGALLFAPKDDTGSGYELLRSVDILRQAWSRCRLAVLSACAAAAGETRGAHNPESLVRALTRAGVSRVAASLWSVDSAATAELMRVFYASLAANATPLESLEQAREQVRSHPEWNHPYYWAGFQLYGTT